MITFIANSILTASKKSIAEGQNKYRAYFINTKIYEAYRLDVEAILRQEGKEDCIVTA